MTAVSTGKTVSMEDIVTGADCSPVWYSPRLEILKECKKEEVYSDLRIRGFFMDEEGFKLRLRTLTA